MTDLSYFRNRRTVRSFSDRKVDDVLLHDIIADALRAPTCGNMQLYSVVATREPDNKAAMARCHFNQPAATGCDVILTVCADFNRFVKWCEHEKAEPGFDNFQSFFSAVADAFIFTQQLVTSAEMRGLGTCYLGTVTYNAPDIAGLLGLPSRVVPVAAIALGWPDGEPEQVERLGVEAVLHNEQYHDYNPDEIKRLFRPKDDFAPNRKYVVENGKQSLAQVFTDVRYPKADNELFSGVFLRFIAESGFLQL